MIDLMIPKEPVNIAIIGAGERSSVVYKPSYSSLTPWVKVVAVCDPVKTHADKLASDLGAVPYYDIHKLVADNIAEAAIVITPVDSHYSISKFLSYNKIHNMVETTWCNTIMQAKGMIKAARDNNVITCVAENFFRFAIDRFSNVLRDSGYIGKIHRIYSYNDHTGYHNNNRWIHFAKSYPEWVQMITHTMPTVEFTASPETRKYNSETFRSKYYSFPENFMVIDNNSNIKGFLGRQCRPGHTEWHGENGTLTHLGKGHWDSETLIKKFITYASTEDTKVNYEIINERFKKISAQTPSLLLEYVNPYDAKEIFKHTYPDYSIALMDQIVNFALAIRGLQPLEYPAESAMMALLMELASEQSALEDGRRIYINEDMDFEVEKKVEKRLQQEYGFDPYDIEAMLSVSYFRK
jgi:predicted dehydrogenase